MELENPYIEIIILFKNKIEKRRLMNIKVILNKKIYHWKK